VEGIAVTVRAILSLKGGDVTTIKPTASHVTAAKVLAERRIGALVVTDTAEHVAGILSERDIVRALAERGPAALCTAQSARVSQLMAIRYRPAATRMARFCRSTRVSLKNC
jgi:CBS-domain-containing membrane protein